MVDFMNISINDLVKSLHVLLELEREAVGIRFLLSEEDFNNSKLNIHPSGMAYCTAVRNASRGKKYKMNKESSSCIAASWALGFSLVNNDTFSGKRHYDSGVYKNLAVSRSVANDMVYCKHKSYGVEIMPLKEYKDSSPDVVIVVTNPYNSMRILQGYAYHHGQLKNIKMAGMCGICQDCTSYPFEMNSVNVSMLCSGTRCVAQWNKDEMAIGMTFHHFIDIVDGIKKTVNPMESNKEKSVIEGKFDSSFNKSELEVKYNNNYYRGLYGTPEQVEKRNKS